MRNLTSSKKYRVKLYNTETKEGVITTITFRKQGEAEAFVQQWKAQGEPFGADLLIE